MGDYATGIATVPVWKSATTFLNRTEALALADGTQNGTEYHLLSSRDFRRSQAVALFEREYVEVFFVSLLQGEIVSQTVFAGIVLSSVIKVNVKTVASLYFPFEMPWLIVASLCSFLVSFKFRAITLIARGMELMRLCSHAPVAALLPARVGQEFLLGTMFIYIPEYGATLFYYNFFVLALYNVALWRLSVIHVSGPFRLLPWLCSFVQGARPESASTELANEMVCGPRAPPLDEEDSGDEIEISSVWMP